jgi:tetratricopeptide (TPR) repeat protein
MNIHDKDLNELKALVTAEPNNLEFVIALAEALANEGAWEQSITAYQKALTLQPDDPDIYNELGVLYVEIGDNALSEEAFQKALACHPGHPYALLNLGFLYREQERFSEALHAFQWSALLSGSGEERNEALSCIGEILSEHGEEVEPAKLVKVTETMGAITAEIIASRLRSEGILAAVWQEGVGQAYGLNVGPLGTRHVVVMEKDAQEARDILAHVEALAPAEALEGEPGTLTTPTFSPLVKTILGATAVAFNPIGAGIAYLLSTFSTKDTVITCPFCDTELELDSYELEQGWYVCAACEQTVSLDGYFALDNREGD